MTALIENHIETAVADPDNYNVHLRWRNGARTVARFGHLVGHGVFKPLSNPEFFKRVSPERDGRALAWPGTPEERIEFCADALWFGAHPEDAPKELAPFFPH